MCVGPTLPSPQVASIVFFPRRVTCAWIPELDSLFLGFDTDYSQRLCVVLLLLYEPQMRARLGTAAQFWVCFARTDLRRSAECRRTSNPHPRRTPQYPLGPYSTPLPRDLW